MLVYNFDLTSGGCFHRRLANEGKNMSMLMLWWLVDNVVVDHAVVDAVDALLSLELIMLLLLLLFMLMVMYVGVGFGVSIIECCC